MNIYYLEQSENRDYDTYDSMVVAAKSKEEAIRMSPSDCYEWNENGYWEFVYFSGKREREIPSCWVSHIDKIDCRLIGKAETGVDAGIICYSFNAG